MKKTVSLMLALLMAAGLIACGTKAQEETLPPPATTAAATQAAETTAAAEAETAATAAMVNPMAEVTDPAEFSGVLGIDIDPAMLYAETKLFIIDGKIAECRFSFENIMGESVDCTLRATKDEEAAKNLHGIFDSTLKSISDFDYSCDQGDFTITLSENDAGDITVYTWKTGDVWYSFVLQGKPSGMELAEAMDSVMFATVGETSSVGAAEDALQAENWYELNEEGTELMVRLSGNATTGFLWSAKIWDPQSLEEVHAEYTPDANPGGMVGVGGTWAAVYRVPAGLDTNGVFGRQNEITFTYARDWETEKIPSKALDLLIHENTMEIIGVHEPDLTTPVADDGEYEVTLNFENMLEENELSFYALVGLPKIITFTEEEVKAVKVGDVIDLEQYGLINIDVDRVNRLDETSIEITDAERFEYHKDLKAWVIRGLDDDIYKYDKEMRKVHFTNETFIDDGMEEIMKTGNTGTIYDKMRTYRNVDAKITVKDGWVEKIRIYYHP